VRFAITAALALAFATPALADVLVDNVDGLTVDEAGKVERFTGLLIGKDGRIEQVFQRGDKRPAKVDYLVDGKGRVAMPGLIDSHVEVMKLGLSTLTLDLAPAKSLAEAQARVAAWTAANSDKPWILGRGWNGEALGRAPTAADLDTIAKPVWLIDADGDAGWANSAALAAAGITAATKDPLGGKIERGAGGKPTGLLTGTALALVERIVPAPRPEDRDLAFAAAQQLLLERGVTAVADMGTSILDWQSFRRAGDAGSLRIRIMAYADGIDATVLIGGPGPSPWLYDDRLRLNGVMLQLDGAVSSRSAALKAPYADAPATSGTLRLGEAQLRNMMSRAAIDNFQIALVANGDKAVGTALAAIGELTPTYKGDRRWRIEGADVVDLADLPGLGKSGVTLSMQPSGLATSRPVIEARLGAARLSGVQAWKSVSAAGAKLAFGSGAPIRTPEVFVALAAAAGRQDKDGQPFGGWQPQERLPREATLAAFSAGAARAGFAEGRFGRLVKGQRADFLLVNRDPTLASATELRATQVLEVWIGGQLAWARKGGGDNGR
jgi:predicted amidohydrolase YtcJ